MIRETIAKVIDGKVGAKNAFSTYSAIRKKYELSGTAAQTLYRRVGITVHNAYNLQTRSKCFLYSLDFQGAIYSDREFYNSGEAMAAAKSHVDRIADVAGDKVLTKGDFKALADRT